MLIVIYGDAFKWQRGGKGKLAFHQQKQEEEEEEEEEREEFMNF